MESRPPPVAEGGRRRALSKREDFDREGERATILQAGRKSESNRRSHDRSKARPPPVLFAEERDQPNAALSKREECERKRRSDDHFARAGSESSEKSEFRDGPEADRRRWRRKGGEGRLAKGRISTGREKDDHFASWTKVRKKRADGKPTAAGGGGREAKGA